MNAQVCVRERVCEWVGVRDRVCEWGVGGCLKESFQEQRIIM